MKDSRAAVPLGDGSPTGRLRAAAAGASALLTRLAVRPGPPPTSQERRRNAVEAERWIVELDEACRALELWGDQGQPPAVTTLSGQQPDLEAPSRGGSVVEGATVDGTAAVTAAQAALENARAHLDQSVAAARASGASWRQIGAALGITGQTAHKRFDPAARRRHADYMRLRNQQMAGR